MEGRSLLSASVVSGLPRVYLICQVKFLVDVFDARVVDSAKRHTDKTHRRAVENGALVLHEPMEMDYGERASAVMDAAGNHWYIATYRRK